MCLQSAALNSSVSMRFVLTAAPLLPLFSVSGLRVMMQEAGPEAASNGTTNQNGVACGAEGGARDVRLKNATTSSDIMPDLMTLQHQQVCSAPFTCSAEYLICIFTPQLRRIQNLTCLRYEYI